ncbi:11573_t:CDS:2, partial [Cetraspora pellucida]
MLFRYLNEICEKLFQDKKKIILDIIQKNSQTKDVLYKERIDAVCNHLLKRFENEEKYEEKLEDIEFIKKIANHVKDKMNFEYVCFYENAENLSETVLMEIFCETIPNRYEEMRMPYNYYRLRLLVSHVSKYDYSKFLYTIDNLLKEKLDETLLEYFSLYPIDSIQSSDLLSIILLAEPIYFKCFKNNYMAKEPFHVRYLDIYKTYSEYKNAKTPEYKFNNTLMEIELKKLKTLESFQLIPAKTSLSSFGKNHCDRCRLFTYCITKSYWFNLEYECQTINCYTRNRFLQEDSYIMS